MSLLQTVRAEVRALDPSPGALRQFGVVVGGVLAVVAGLLLWRRGLSSWVCGLGGIGGALMLVGLVAPVVLRPIRQAWMTGAFVMGFVMTRVILTAAWVLVFIPIGLTMRVLGKTPLARRLDPSATTYWIPRGDGGPDRDQLERYF